MWTRLLMISSAAVMLLLGALLTFAPRETLAWTGSQASSLLVLAVQALGALYLGFAALNWMAKDNLIGGIYSRPVSLGNFVHFFVMGANLLRALPAEYHVTVLWVAAIVYVIFAACFGLVVFGGSLPKAPR
jgi:hypothetical protein